MCEVTLADIPEQFESRALLGLVNVVGCVEDSDSPWAGGTRYQWILANARPFAEPLKVARGYQKIWLWRAPSTPIITAAADDRPPQQPAQDIDRLDAEAVLAAFAAVASRTPENDIDVYRAVSKKLGFARMGTRIEAVLRHARSAVRKGILLREGKRLQSSVTGGWLWMTSR